MSRKYKNKLTNLNKTTCIFNDFLIRSILLFGEVRVTSGFLGRLPQIRPFLRVTYNFSGRYPQSPNGPSKKTYRPAEKSPKNGYLRRLFVREQASTRTQKSKTTTNNTSHNVQEHRFEKRA
jgi:hypothetical protein